MKEFFFNNKINILFLLIALISVSCVLGIQNIPFQSTKWLHDTGNDTAIQHLGWHFFKNDIWRFPLGSNPNYGDELGNSIVFTDSVPILALFFKLFKPILPDHFQYFSLWYFICFYFQLFFSYKILKYFTRSDIYSIVGSIFFIIAPILIYRIQIGHQAVLGQWLLLFTLYLVLTKKIDESKLLWLALIIISSLVHYQILLMILVVYSLLRLFNLKFDKESFYKITRDFLILGCLLLFTLYVVGYFEIRIVDTLALGFGDHKLNILSILDPIIKSENINFSHFLPDIDLSLQEEAEGFNYLGLGQILMIIFALTLFLIKRSNIKIQSLKNNKEIKFLIIISVVMTFWALSNQISFGSNTLIEIPLHKYIYGALSMFKNTGRMFWIVNYFLIILSIIVIFICFEKKNSIIIISLFLAIQVIDISKGINAYSNPFRTTNKSELLQDEIWKELFTKYKVIKTTYPKAYSDFFTKLSYAIEKNNIKKTNIVKMARMNRKAAADAKYDLYNSFNNLELSDETIYVINGSSHLRNLKYLFKDKNVGFFYRDNIWLMILNEKHLMNDSDKEMFNAIQLETLSINQYKNLNFVRSSNTYNQENIYYGFGWSHNFSKAGIWSEGYTSTLLFNTEKFDKRVKLEIYCTPHITKKNQVLELDIFINNLIKKKIKLSDSDKDHKIEILLFEKDISGNEIKVDFHFKNPISPYEVFDSPDSRKLGLLIKKISISNN